MPTERLCADGMVFNDYTPIEEKCDLPYNIDCTKRSKLREYRAKFCSLIYFMYAERVAQRGISRFQLYLNLTKISPINTTAVPALICSLRVPLKLKEIKKIKLTYLLCKTACEMVNPNCRRQWVFGPGLCRGLALVLGASFLFWPFLW